jgi:hypothetical protein
MLGQHLQFDPAFGGFFDFGRPLRPCDGGTQLDIVSVVVWAIAAPAVTVSAAIALNANVTVRMIESPLTPDLHTRHDRAHGVKGGDGGMNRDNHIAIGWRPGARKSPRFRTSAELHPVHRLALHDSQDRNPHRDWDGLACFPAPTV